jgi:thioredoxin-like negative regulator of GroEL
VGRRLTRKQIKKDEFITFVDRVVHWVGANWKQAAAGLGGVIVLGLLYWGVSAFLGARTESAGKALDHALAIYSAPVGSAAPADAKIKFATDTERLDAAEKAFKAIQSRYYLTPQARLVPLYLAHIAADRGDIDQAARTLAAIASKHNADPEVRIATLDLIRLRIAQGEGKQLVPELEAMVAGRDPRLPRDVALYELAQVWDHEGKPDEAAKLYRNLVENYPESSYRFDAQQHLAASS